LMAGARERTRGCSPQAPGQFRKNRLGDFSCCLGEVFVLLVGARECTLGCSPRAPGRFRQNRLGGVCQWVCVCFLVEMELSTKASLCNRGD